MAPLGSATVEEEGVGVSVPTTTPREEPVRIERVGKDELNLTDRPFWILKNRKDHPTRLEFSDGKTQWIVNTSSDHGLPTSADVDVYVVLMELTREQSVPDQVFFTVRELCRRLGWNDSGASYQRVDKALDRLWGVGISTTRFYDRATRTYVAKDRFRLLERVHLVRRADNRNMDENDPRSWIRWSPEILTNYRAGYLKSLNVSLYLSFETDYAKLLYRYLDRRGWDGKETYEEPLLELAQRHLGIEPRYAPSQIRQRLEPAHRELVDKRFLRAYEYFEAGPRRTDPLMIRYHYGALVTPRGGYQAETSPRRSPATPAELPLPAPNIPAHPPLSPPEVELLHRLLALEVDPLTARELVRDRPEVCRRQLEYLPLRKADRNAAGLLVRSIQGDWARPEPTEHERAEQSAVRVAEQTRRELHTRQREDLRIREERQAWESYWSSLQEEAQERSATEARLRLLREQPHLAPVVVKEGKELNIHGLLQSYLQDASGWKALRQRLYGTGGTGTNGSH